MKRLLLIATLATTVSSCSEFYRLDVELSASGRMTLVAYRDGLFGESLVPICPSRIVIETLTSAGRRTVYQRYIRGPCAKFRSINVLPVSPSGDPIILNRGTETFGVSVFTKDGKYASSGWIRASVH